MIESKQLRDYVRRVCCLYGCTQSEIADTIGVAKQTLSNYLNGYRVKDVSALYQRVVEAFPETSDGRVSASPGTVTELRALVRSIVYTYGILQRDMASGIGVTAQTLSDALHGRREDVSEICKRLRGAYPQAAGRVTAVSNSRDGGHAITVSQSNHSGSNSCTVGDAGQVRVDSLLALLDEKDRQISRLQEQVTQLIGLIGRQRQ